MPETRYARSGDVSIAYQVTGDGPFDVVHIPPFLSHLELSWQVLVSSTVKDLVAGSGIEFRDRGVAELKSVPGGWRLFAVDRLAAT